MVVGQLRPHRELALGIGAEGERHQRIHAELLVAIGIEQLGRERPKAQALLDGALGDAEARGDGGGGGAVRGERGEGLHLIGRMHGGAHDVLRE